MLLPVIGAVAGTSWLIALFVPWTTGGALSSASLLDAVGLIRRGTVDALVPPGTAVLLVVPAVAGIVLIGATGFAGRAVDIVRGVALAVGAIGALGLACLLTGLDPSTAGPGVWVALVGVLAALAAAARGAYRLLRAG